MSEDSTLGKFKKRISITITEPYLEALDSLVEQGIYLSRGEVVMELLRRFFREQRIEPFHLETKEPIDQ